MTFLRWLFALRIYTVNICAFFGCNLVFRMVELPGEPLTAQFGSSRDRVFFFFFFLSDKLARSKLS